MRPEMLAQGSATNAPSFGPLLAWIGALLIVLLAGALILVWLRRRLIQLGRESKEGLTLHSLRELRERGVLSEEEFEQARSALIGIAGGADPSAREAREGFDLAGDPLPGADTGGAGDQNRQD